MLGDVMVRSHTFRFIVPAEAERLKMPDAVHDLSHRQDASLGDGGVEDVAGVLAMASRPVTAALGT